MTYPGTPLIDGDLIVYRASSACKEDEPVSYALHNVKLTMERICDRFDRGLSQRTYLTGEGNYRVALATIKPYKGNRTQPKPQYLPDCREYLGYAWNATVVDGKEADDALATEQYSHKDRSTCIVTIDKDLLYGVPGWKYNFLKEEYFYTTVEEADWYFYKQVLTGDPTDNIRGVEGIGDKKAAKILDGVNGRKALYNAVLRVYTDKYGKEEGLRQMHETCHLVWIQREEDVLWQEP